MVDVPVRVKLPSPATLNPLTTLKSLTTIDKVCPAASVMAGLGEES